MIGAYDGLCKEVNKQSPVGPPDGVERRSADRPWTGPKAAEKVEEAAAPAPQRKAATAGGDQE